jgi:hypothetical protein
MVEPYDANRLSRPPTMSEYATAKKEYEIGVDKADGEDQSVEMIVDVDTLLLMYWNTIPKDQKFIIKAGDEHDKTRFPSKPA